MFGIDWAQGVSEGACTPQKLKDFVLLKLDSRDLVNTLSQHLVKLLWSFDVTIALIFDHILIPNKLTLQGF